ncbi:MAG: right-handed parallel beta-helix repeat-containing protein [Ignavibacteria bacterium]|nr:right-handed parallel beta-helix repeat-containing protein [Ignavibacteria bacterium]
MRRFATIFSSFAIVFAFLTTIDSFAQYCSVTGYYPQGGYMTQFVFNGINNRSTYASSGYSDFTSVRSNPCLPGQSYSFTVDGYSWWNCTGYVIWIDWNQDRSFNNTDELVAYKWESCRARYGGSWTKTYTGTIRIPSNARLGETRMRVAYTGHHYYAQPLVYYGACYSYYYMEWEDYTIVIGARGNDAGIADIVSPQSKFNSYQNQPVRVVLKNFGKYFPLTSVTINWSVDGVSQTPFNWSGYLDTGATTVVEIHSGFRFNPQPPWNPFTIRAWTSNPRGPDAAANAQPDTDPTNDSYSKNIPCILHDAGVISAAPMLPLNPGINPVRLRIYNYAPRPLNSVYINWSVYGQFQTPYYWTGNLASRDSIDVTVGAYDFGTANIPVPIVAWTSYPNGYPDENTANDTLSTQVYKALAPGIYTVGGREPDFANLIDFVSFVGYWGMAGPVTLLIRPGTYSANFSLSPVGVRQYPLTFESQTGRKEDVIISASPTSAAGNFVIEINRYNDVIFRNVTLRNNSCTFGRVLVLRGGNSNITLDNCELIGCLNPAKTTDFALLFSDNNRVLGLNIMNSTFRNGSVGIWHKSPSGQLSQTFSIDNNIFVGQNWQGIRIEDVQGCLVTNNSVSGTNLINGIFVQNGSLIRGNRVNGVGPSTSTSLTDNMGGICVIHTTTGFEGANVEDNVVMTTNSNGIYLSGVNAFNIVNNSITLSTTGTFDKSGIVLINSGFEFTNYQAGSFVSKNSIFGTNTHGIYASGSRSIKFYRNYVKLSGNNKYGLFIINSPSLIANNLITTLNASALQLNNLSGTMLLYNTLFSNTSGPTALFSTLRTTNIFKRNIFFNKGTGFAVQVSGTIPTDLIMDENNLYTSGTSLSNLGATLAAWRSATGRDMNSSSVVPQFISDDNPRINKIDGRLYLRYPLPELMGTVWQDEVENADIDGTRRYKAFYMGVNTLNPEIRILEQPKKVVGCVGHNGHFLSVLAEIDFGGELSFQWYFNGQPVVGATQPILMLPTLRHDMAGIYYCLVSGTGEAEPVRSKDALLYALMPTKITRQPTTTYLLPGEVATFQIDMHITPEEKEEVGEPMIQWYRGNTPLRDNDRIAGSNSSILTIKDVKHIDYATNYYVIVRGLCGADTSKPITLAEKPKVVFTLLNDLEACKGATTSISITATSTVPGYNLVYQWRFNGTPITDNNKYQGTNTATLTISNLEFSDGGRYDCVIRIPGFDEVISNGANLVVYAPPKIEKGLPTSLNVETGKPIRLEIVASGDNLSYLWYKNDTELPYVTSILEISSARAEDAGTYKVKVYNQCGEVWSNECQVTVTMKTILKKEVQDFNIELFQNVPNPFDSHTKIEFTLPESMIGEIKITNPYGELIAILKGEFTSGLNTINISAEDLNLVPGVYFYTLQVEGKRYTKKMIYVK